MYPFNLEIDILDTPAKPVDEELPVLLLDTSDTSSTSSLDVSQNSKTLLHRDENWVNSFEIQWDKMSKTLTNSLKKSVRPSPRDRRAMIRMVCDDILKVDANPKRKNLSVIAERIVAAYPKSFVDDIGGEIIGSGSASVLRQLENRINNFKRSDKSLPFSACASSSLASTSDEEGEHKPKRAKVQDSYGCINWQPKELPPGEDETTQKDKVIALKQMYSADRDTWDMDIISSHMDSLYFTIRTQINSKCMTIDALLEEYPFLMEDSTMMRHFKKLVGIELKATLEESIEGKGQRILRYLKQVSRQSSTRGALKVAFEQLNDAKLAAQDCSPELPGLLLLLATYFGEDVGSLLVLCKVSLCGQT